RLDKTYQAFFRRLKAGEKAGLARYQGHDRWHSFTSKEVGNSVTLDTGFLVLSKIGRIVVRWSRQIGRVSNETRRAVRQTRRASRRTIFITIAAILLFLLGGVQLVLAITEFFRTNFGALAPLEGDSSPVWGFVDVLFALVLIYARYPLL